MLAQGGARSGEMAAPYSHKPEAKAKEATTGASLTFQGRIGRAHLSLEMMNKK
jgi:hypothetical protein